jgi:CheY-like chemotaxis protein
MTGPGRDILVVEDDPLSAVLVRDLLASRDHRVRTAANVDEALAQLAAARPDLVLLDVQLPGGGGEAVLKAIRADQSSPLAPLPVVAVTALAMAGDRERLLALGFDAYVSKPISIKSLLALVDSLLAKA